MPLYTSTYLKQLSENKTSSIRSKLLTESTKTHASFDIFLSHSYLDKKEVEGIYIELSNKGYSVYVDWIIDPTLNRNNVTKQSAELVRKRMKASKTLLLAVSTNAVLSKWIPWELGYVDGNTNKCAIFPVADGNTIPKTFIRSEYLLLYPYIKKASIGYSDELFLTESKHYYVSFDNWVKRNLQPDYKSRNIDEL